MLTILRSCIGTFRLHYIQHCQYNMSNPRILRSRVSALTSSQEESKDAIVKNTTSKSRIKSNQDKSEKNKNTKSKIKSVVAPTVKIELKDDNESKTIESDHFKDSKSSKNQSPSPRKRNIKTETDDVAPTVKIELKEDNESKTIESDYFKDSKSSKKQSPSPRKRKIKTETDDKSLQKASKLEVDPSCQDIEDVAWEPKNWKEVHENTLKMRKLHIAPVDSLGCEECPDKDAKPEDFRYQTLISVMLSSQTRDEVTYAATQRLIEHGLTVDSILSTSDEKIGELIYPAGFWKSKVKYIKNTTQILKDQYNGEIPRTFKELCKLPGVGPKMANIVMSVAWDDTVGIAVDTHVHRISNRLGWVPKPTKDPEQTRKALESWLPKELWKDCSLDLVGFGQTICKPTKPKCEDCLNSRLCPSSTIKT